MNKQKNIIPRDLLDLLPGLLLVVEQDGRILESNSRTAEALQIPESELAGLDVAELCPAEARPQVRSLLRDCASAVGKSHALTTTLRAPGREPVDVELTVKQYVRKDKDPLVVIVGRDISLEKRRDLDLLRFSNIAHYTVNPLEITDVQGRIIYVNPAFEKASGYPQEELLGKNPNVFGSGKHPKGFWKKMWETISAGKVWTGEIENRRKDGEPFFTHLLISPIIDAGGKIVGHFGVHRDITPQKALEKQLIHAQKMESIGLLAAGIAHEVGNPLTSISSIVQVIQRTTEDEFTLEKLELIKSQITRISRIIRDLVDFSRRSSYELELTDLNKSIREAVEIVRVGRKAKSISFEMQLERSIPMLALVPDQIEQVFINILINAVDAIREAAEKDPKAKGNGHILVRSALTETYAIAAFEDNGTGISEDSMPKIFEPFFTTKHVGEGTGLGLWVSYGIIKSFRGSITVDSTEGKGTTFTIALPLHSELS